MSNDHSQVITNDNRLPRYVSKNIVVIQTAVKIFIVLFVLFFSYLLYGKFLKQKTPGFRNEKDPQFIGDLYDRNQGYSQGRKRYNQDRSRTGKTENSGGDPEYITYANGSEISGAVDDGAGGGGRGSGMGGKGTYNQTNRGGTGSGSDTGISSGGYSGSGSDGGGDGTDGANGNGN